MCHVLITFFPLRDQLPASVKWANVPFDPAAVSALQPASMAMAGESSSGTASPNGNAGSPAQAGSAVDQPATLDVSSAPPPLTNEGVNTLSTGSGSSFSAAHACSPQSTMVAMLGAWAVLAMALVF